MGPDSVWRLYWDNGKENGNYYRIMEKKMEATGVILELYRGNPRFFVAALELILQGSNGFRSSSLGATSWAAGSSFGYFLQAGLPFTPTVEPQKLKS